MTSNSIKGLKFPILLCLIFFLACEHEQDPAEVNGKHPPSLIWRSDSRPEGLMCFVGATGTGEEMQYMVAETMIGHGCTEIFHLGDVILPKGILYEDQPLLKTHFFGPYQPLIDGGAHFNLVMGDHDHEGFVKAWTYLAKENPAVIFPHMYYAQVWGDICFVAVDTVLAAQEKQSAWLNALLEKKEDRCKFTVAMGHYPYLSVGPHGEPMPEVKKFLEKHVLSKADIYLSGHDHILSDEGEVRGTRLLVSGGGGAELHELVLEPQDFAMSTHGFVSMEFAENEDGQVVAHYAFIEVDNEGGAHIVHENSVLGE